MYRSTRPLPSFDKVEDCKVVMQGIGEESEMEHIPLVEYRDIL